MRQKIDQADVALARLAARQHGVVTARQLQEVGIDESGAYRRVRTGRLHRVHWGVYAVGHRGLSQEGRWMAAVLACGTGAALSHRSAAALWGMLPRSEGPIHVSTSARSGRARQACIRLHRCTSLAPGLIVAPDRIPVTTPARTVADLSGSVPTWELRRAVRQAGFLGLDLGPEVESDGTRSELERDFLGLCRRHRLPRPEVNVPVGPWTVDFLWRRERLAVETDGYGAHRGRAAFEADHGRDLDLRRRGLEVRRFTYRQVHDAPAAVAADLRDALALSS